MLLGPQWSHFISVIRVKNCKWVSVFSKMLNWTGMGLHRRKKTRGRRGVPSPKCYDYHYHYYHHNWRVLILFLSLLQSRVSDSSGLWVSVEDHGSVLKLCHYVTGCRLHRRGLHHPLSIWLQTERVVQLVALQQVLRQRGQSSLQVAQREAVQRWETVS